MAKYAIFGDNRAVYVGASFEQVCFWHSEDLLKDVRHDYLYNIEEIDDEKEKALKQAAADGYIFLYYPKITPEKYYK